MLPTVILPGYFESADVYLPLQQALTKIGTKATTVPLRIRDWLPTLGGKIYLCGGQIDLWQKTVRTLLDLQ